jgi:hypothetical protein
MTDQVIPDGTYTVMGPGGRLTMPADGMGVVLLPPEDDTNQQWTLAFDSGTYTLQNVETGLYLGNDGDPNDPSMRVMGTRQPFTWQLSTGTDRQPNTYVLTSAASSAGLVLTLSLLRIYPPQLAILDPNNFSVVEWAFNPA